MALFDFISAGASIFNNERNINSQEDTNQANWDRQQSINASNQEIARSNNAAAVDMWNRQTDYNNPTNQMSRLKAAGLNPNLAYGTLAESKMSSPPSLDRANMESQDAIAPRSQNPVAEYQQVKNMQSMNAVNNAEIAKRKAEASTAGSTAKYTTWENEQLMKRGILRSDPTLLRGIGGIHDLLKPIGDWLGNKAGYITLEREKGRRY